MTAPTLPETLARLAQLLPERVRVNAAGDEIRVRWGVIERRPFIDPDLVGRPRWRMLFEHWGAQGWVTVHDMPEQWLEAALREECDARDWYVEQRRSPLTSPTYFARVMASEAYADSPALALALALLSALGGEGS